MKSMAEVLHAGAAALGEEDSPETDEDAPLLTPPLPRQLFPSACAGVSVSEAKHGGAPAQPLSQPGQANAEEFVASASAAVVMEFAVAASSAAATPPAEAEKLEPCLPSLLEFVDVDSSRFDEELVEQAFRLIVSLLVGHEPELNPELRLQVRSFHLLPFSCVIKLATP